MTDSTEITGQGFGEAVEPPTAARPTAEPPTAEAEKAPVSEAPETASATGGREDADLGPLFEGAEIKDAKERWHEIQAGFVDDPKGALQQADELNSEIARALTSALEARTRALQQGVANADTERLRVGLRQYGQLLDRILTL